MGAKTGAPLVSASASVLPAVSTERDRPLARFRERRHRSATPERSRIVVAPARRPLALKRRVARFGQGHNRVSTEPTINAPAIESCPSISIAACPMEAP